MKKALSTLAIALVVLLGNLTMAQTFNYPVKGEQGFSLT